MTEPSQPDTDSSTPIPWTFTVEDGGAWYFSEQQAVVKGRHGDTIAVLGVSGFSDHPDGKANAAFIVRAVNNHAKLLAALEGVGGSCLICSTWHRIGCEHFKAGAPQHPNWPDTDCSEGCAQARDAIQEAKK